MDLSMNMTLGEIIRLPCFSQMQGQFVRSCGGDWLREKEGLTLLTLQQQNPTWFCEDVYFGLNRLREISRIRDQYVFQLSSGAGLIYLPADEKRNATFALLAAGGGYGAVCTLQESLPVAARLNELGIDCFCLNYRTATKESFLHGLMPRPLEDMASALRFLDENRNRFGIQIENYIAGGFSAGGHLCAMWGTPHKGARSYGLPNPKALLLAYPLISLENLQGPMASVLCTGLLGENAKSEAITSYSANRHVDAAYPPVYLCLSEDDTTVPAKDAKDMETALAAANVRCRVERVSCGGHGFGLGTATPARGWVERTIHFMEEK